MNISVDYNDILESLGAEFLEEASYTIEGIYGNLDRAEKNSDTFEESLAAIRRDIHSLKGQAGPFGFPIVTQILHALEDYLEMANEVSPNHLGDIKAFIDTSATILERRTIPDEKETADLLSSLPHIGAKAIGGGQKIRNVFVLLVMPRGTQRTIVGRELISCGFRVTTATNAFEAIQLATSRPPDISIITRELVDISGTELVKIFKTINKTANSQQIMLTSSDDVRSVLESLPPDTVVVHKGQEFFGELTDTLINWGYFGDIA